MGRFFVEIIYLNPSTGDGSGRDSSSSGEGFVLDRINRIYKIGGRILTTDSTDFSRGDRENREVSFINSEEQQRATLTLRLLASHELLPNLSPEGAISNRPLRGLSSWASVAEHISVALAKHLLPLGVYKNTGRRDCAPYPNLPISMAIYSRVGG